ncbi:LuxR C-terminal-related transcriptional regulator [Streptomyces sp. NPDC057798]|uniref:LuxR C-terminal-related transcriptional regulator n=1 Tax=Streptomyces sp. NPDC057798 TaxID=3346252 RepID=UPI00367A3472
MGGSAPPQDGHPVAPGSPEPTSFVDRRAELAAGRRLLARSRLVTLTGPGGVGKTRLATRLADRVRGTFPDGVRFVRLAGLDDPALVPHAAADALGLHDHTDRPPLDVLAGHLGERRLLLVVDNCEHLLTACAELIAALLHGTPHVRVLATTRHRLGLLGEHLLELRPLPVPDPDGDLSDAHRHPALALFADRAAAVDPGFRLTPDNRAAVARLCRRLDGLPLAIELAAGRLRDLGLGRLAEGPDARRELRATVDWSHALCTAEEQLTWARASVLAGSFDLETAEAVCADGVRLRPADVVEAVTGLVDKSVLIRETAAGSVRYRLLDTLRHYGLSRLRTLPGEEPTARLRQRRWMQHLADTCERAWFGPSQRHIVARLRADQDNLRTALHFGLGGWGEGGAAGDGRPGGRGAGLAARGQPPGGPEGCAVPGGCPAAPLECSAAPDERVAAAPVPGEPCAVGGGLAAAPDGRPGGGGGCTAVPGAGGGSGRSGALRLVGALWFYWHACGAPREGRYWVERALEANPEPTVERARALWVAGLLAAVTRELEHGRRLAEEASAIALALGDEAEAAHAGYVIGVITLFLGDLPTALAHFEAAADRGRVPSQHLSLVGLERVELACALGFLGEADRAVAVCEETRRLCERHGEEWVHSYVSRMLALAHTVKRDWPAAEHHAHQALRRKLAVHDVTGIALTLDLLARIATETGAHQHAALLLGGADRVWSGIDRDRWGSAALTTPREDSERRAREALGESAYEKAYRYGGELELAELVGHALDEGRGAPDPAGGPKGSHLTPRESQVADLVAQGLANHQIADRLVIARRTAEGHVERILGKLGLDNRSQLAAWVTARR